MFYKCIIFHQMVCSIYKLKTKHMSADTYPCDIEKHCINRYIYFLFIYSIIKTNTIQIINPWIN